MDRPIIWSHRGRRNIAPENTIPAFQAAIYAGDKAIELDVALSKDGVPVVIHDDTVDRTSSGRGLVSEMTFEELQSLDAGRWFADRFKGTEIPSLKEVLALIDGRMAVNIELKPSAFRVRQEDSVETKVAEIVGRRNLAGSVLISSFSRTLLERYREIRPSDLIGVLVEPRGNFEAAIKTARELDAHSIHPHWEDLLSGRVRVPEEFGWDVFPYTVQTKSDMMAANRFGVQGYFADLPFFD